MNFSDIFKKSFIQAINTGDISIVYAVFLLIIACIFATYIFFIYRLLTRKSFYNKEFNISLSVIIVIVAAIVITIQSSLVVSLGMVGALSIVRFRTAIKNPLDLVFLFWAIADGIIVGAGLPGIAVTMTIIITVGIYVLNAIPVARAPKILIINADKMVDIKELDKIIKLKDKYCLLKSHVISENRNDMIYELKTNDGNLLLDEISKIDGIVRCSLLDHNGEVTF